MLKIPFFLALTLLSAPAWAMDTPKAMEKSAEEQLFTLLRQSEVSREQVLALIAQGANPNAQDYKGCPALVRAAQSGHREACTVLVEKGASVNPRFTYTPLRAAAYRGHADIVLFLLKNGAESNPKGHAALHDAADRGHADVCRILLQNKADVQARNRSGESALYQAAKEGHAAASSTLIQYGADAAAELPDCIVPMSSEGHIDALRVLMGNSLFFPTAPDVAARKKRIEAALITLKRFGLNKDLALIVVANLEEDIFVILSPKIYKALQAWPHTDMTFSIPGAFKNLVISCGSAHVYNETILQLKNAAKSADQPSDGTEMATLLDSETLEATIGKEVFANIITRLAFLVKPPANPDQLYHE